MRTSNVAKQRVTGTNNIVVSPIYRRGGKRDPRVAKHTSFQTVVRTPMDRPTARSAPDGSATDLHEAGHRRADARAPGRHAARTVSVLLIRDVLVHSTTL